MLDTMPEVVYCHYRDTKAEINRNLCSGRVGRGNVYHLKTHSTSRNAIIISHMQGTCMQIKNARRALGEEVPVLGRSSPESWEPGDSGCSFNSLRTIKSLSTATFLTLKKSFTTKINCYQMLPNLTASNKYSKMKSFHFKNFKVNFYSL